jgi:hypothetical protein
MSTTPDISGTEGERLDATVTVDSTFSSQQTQTIELRVEDGGTVVHTDSQDVTLQDSTDSQQITLSWPTSDGDKGVYDLFIQSEQDSIQRLVEVTDTRVVDTFDDGDLLEWTDDSDNSDDWSVTTSPTFSGSHAATSTGGHGDGAVLSTLGDGLDYYPEEGDTVEFYARLEGSGDSLGVQLLADPTTSSGSTFYAGIGFGTAYQVRLSTRSGDIKLVDESSNGDVQTLNVTPPTNEWIQVTADFAGGTVDADISSTSSGFSESLSISFSTEHGRGLALISDGGSSASGVLVDEVAAR